MLYVEEQFNVLWQRVCFSCLFLWLWSLIFTVCYMPSSLVSFCSVSLASICTECSSLIYNDYEMDLSWDYDLTMSMVSGYKVVTFWPKTNSLNVYYASIEFPNFCNNWHMLRRLAITRSSSQFFYSKLRKAMFLQDFHFLYGPRR